MQESGAHADDIQDCNDGKENIRKPTNQYRINIHRKTDILSNFSKSQIEK